MDDKKIIVTVPQVGSPKVEAEGFNGEGCEVATRPIEQALSGGAVESRDYKPEWQNPSFNEEDEEQGVSW